MSEQYKIAVLGDGGVGKTYDPTIEDSYRKQVEIDGEPCMLELLDTAGQEEYTALRDSWISDCQGFVIVYSVTSKTSFERVEKFRDQVIRVKDTEDVPICIVGNKCDAEDFREVSKEEGNDFAKSLNCEFVEASAKTSLNVEKPFITVAKMLRSAMRKEDMPQESGKKKKKGCLLF